MRDDLQCTLRA